MDSRLCPECGRHIVKKPGPGRWPRFCSPACKSAAGRKPAEERVCARCGVMFLSARSAARWCKPRCRDLHNYETACVDGRYEQWLEAQREKRANAAAAQPERICGFCPRPITSKHPATKTCGDPTCRGKNNARRALATQRRLAAEFAARGESYRDQWGRNSYSPSAARRGAKGDPIDRDKVGERDGWICGICRKPINQWVRYPDPSCPSLDHVVSLSNGGTHTWDNVQISHYDCNIRKKNRDDWSPHDREPAPDSVEPG